ncbi:DNA polymerase epsilon subunit 4-like [Panulirus ornatus]|uniref:DNA polymerase epsilon subunit 4-like n=1 Tax=Panulirus ornatus TaxID=150431 RepID=UPI003A87C713
MLQQGRLHNTITNMAGTEAEISDGVDGASEEVVLEADEDRGSGLRLPLLRIKKIMKVDPDLNWAAHDAVYLVTKATELFIESLVQEAWQFTYQSRKKTVSRRDVDNCIEAIDALAFLDGALE